MKKHRQGNIWLTGSRKEVNRLIYTNGQQYFIMWYGAYIEVKNRYGTENTLCGWYTVEPY